MNDSRPTSNDQVHPLQPLVNRTIKVLGPLFAFLLAAMTGVSLYLLISSAFFLSDFVGLLVSVLAVAGYIFVRLTHNLIRHSPILIGVQKTPVTNLSVVWLLLILCEAVQILLWVVDSGNDVHEPRIAFIGLTAYAMWFSHKQFQKHSNKFKQS